MIVSGMSGNEIYCLALKGLQPHDLVVGNSVVSLGVLGGLGAWGKGVTGGEVRGNYTLPPITILDEAGSRLARELWSATRRRYSNELGYIETCAALAASLRNHTLDPTDHATAVRSADAIRSHLVVVEHKTSKPIGVFWRSRSSGPMSNAAWIQASRLTIDRCDTTVPLGRPVDPDVKIR